MGVPTKAVPTQSTQYFITAKHVLLDPVGKLLHGIVLRMDSATEGFYNLYIPFEGPNACRVFTNSDQSVDIAVVNMIYDSKSTKMKSFPASLIASREAFKRLDIREGDEMFFLGLFTPFYGAKHNLPIFRFGRLSMLPDEKIPFAQGGEQKLILMETQVFGGNSGSPCFFYFDERRNPNDAKIFLAGVVKGYFRDWSEVKFVETKQTPISESNVGISAIIPGYYILDILECDELRKWRAFVDQALSSRGPTNATPVTPAQQNAIDSK